jgi:hypothetical protein
MPMTTAPYGARARIFSGAGRLVLVAGALIAGCSAGGDRDPRPARAGALMADRASVTPAAAADASPTTSVVTLITGDRVYFTHGGGRDQVLSVVAGPEREDIAFMSRVSRRGKLEDVLVLPSDAAPLVASGALDVQLFNVSALERQGFDDGKTTTLPIIVTYRSTPLARTHALARTTHWLSSINGEALAADKQDARRVWSWLTGGGAPSRMAARALTPGIAKVWLDARASLLLNQSAPQIGAPHAWQSGFTGKGVTVAVLDTGVKADHPDLVGKVTEAVDFTGTKPDAGDDVGHGTHCAGIITGSGAASGGLYKGIAPDVSLIVGKVCTVSGCATSAIIAGMEWAAPKSRIVSMSLGSTDASDGSDPLARAVNTLTAQYGTLFVAAAGNSGDEQSVGSPAAADAALAVGSVSKQDDISVFSSRGPRIGDYAVKPEIAAPGGAIVAARAKGTPVGDIDPVDDNYTRLSGTSMATPHVAGGAALLAQQHPDWSAAQLKAALMSSAKPLSGLRVADEGSGRMDLARATTQPLHANMGSLSFGVVPFPHTGPLSKTVTYRNDGAAQVTLTLTLTTFDSNGQPSRAGMFAVDQQVIVPAHGSADATVTVAGQASVNGFFSGLLTASDGTNSVETAVDVFEEPERYNLTINSIDTTGAPSALRFGGVFNVDTSEESDYIVAGANTLRLDRGEYDVSEIINSGGIITFGTQPSVILDKDMTVTIDGRTAKPVTAVVDRPSATLWWTSISVHSISRSNVGTNLLTLASKPLYATPTAPVTGHGMTFDFREYLHPAAPPAGAAPTEDYIYNLTFSSQGGIPGELTYRVYDRDLAVVHENSHASGVASASRSNLGTTADGAASIIPTWDQPLPGKRVEYYTANLPWTQTLQLLPATPPYPPVGERTIGTETYEPGRHYWRDWNSAPFGPSFGPSGSQWGAYRINNQLGIFLTPFSPAERDHSTQLWTGTTTLSRNGNVLGSSKFAGYASFAVPADEGTYALDVHGTQNVAWSVLDTVLDASWIFHSAPATDTQRHDLPLLIVHVSSPVDDLDSAPAGLPYVLALEIQRQPGALAPPLTELALEVSYDDGATWQEAPVAWGGERGLALVFHPLTPGFVSLRAHAADSNGNAVTQTVLHAYRTAALQILRN